MAHRADVIQVHMEFPLRESQEIVVDPICKKKLSHKEARNILFRENETLYFCSKECREKYLSPKKGSSSKAA